MDKKQFELFQTAIQWVADEQRRRTRHQRKNGLVHNQTIWASGKITEWIKARWGHHGEHQMAVVCASSCCLAGNIVQLHGDKFVSPVAGYYIGQEIPVEHCLDDEQQVHNINTRAQKLAGLTDEQATELFTAKNTANTIIKRAKVISACNGYDLEVM